MDDQGWLWFKFCGVDILINFIGLFQFDGYFFQFIEVFEVDGSIFDVFWIRIIEESGCILGIKE